MGEDGQEAEVPRWRSGQGTGEAPSRYPGKYGAERICADRRTDFAARQAELIPRASGRTIVSSASPHLTRSCLVRRSEKPGSVRGIGRL